MGILGYQGVMGVLWDATKPPPAHRWDKTSPNSPRIGRVVGKSHISTGGLCQTWARVGCGKGLGVPSQLLPAAGSCC